MRNRRIGLLDVGLDASFDASMTFVQSTIQNINAGYDEPVADIDFVRSRDPYTAVTALTAQYHVLHVMAHGGHYEGPMFSSSDGKVTLALDELGAFAESRGHGIQCGAILADGCKTGIGVWQRAIRDCLQDNITYIGTSANIGWHESTVFCSAFYGSLFRNKGRGATPAEQAADAAARAAESYKILTGRKCPYTVSVLTPSRAARRAFG